jgi:uncharacterized protein YdhG (YjbR/CyaY superfamily)
MGEPAREGTMSEKKATQKSAKRTTTKRKTSTGLSPEERAAAKARVQELRAEARGADMENAVLAAIAEMPEPDRSMAKRIHAIVKASAPSLSPKTWYGMPAYANEDGKVICFFKAASKYNERYATFGFDQAASLDDGNMWPTSFGLTKLTAAEEAKIGKLVKKAVS